MVSNSGAKNAKKNKKRNRRRRRKAAPAQAPPSVRLTRADIKAIRAGIADEEMREAKSAARRESRWLSTCEDADPFYILPSGHEALGRAAPVIKVQGTFTVGEGGSGYVAVSPFTLPSACDAYDTNGNARSPCYFSKHSTNPVETGTETIPKAGTIITGSPHQRLSLLDKNGHDWAAPVAGQTANWVDDAMHVLPLKACIEINCSAAADTASGFIQTRVSDSPTTAELGLDGYAGMNANQVVGYDWSKATDAPVNRKMRDAVTGTIQIKWFNGAKASRELFSPQSYAAWLAPGAMLSAQWKNLSTGISFTVTVSLWFTPFGHLINTGPERPISTVGQAIMEATAKKASGSAVVPPNAPQQTSYWKGAFDKVIEEVSGPIMDVAKTTFVNAAEGAVLGLL